MIRYLALRAGHGLLMLFGVSILLFFAVSGRARRFSERDQGEFADIAGNQ